MFVWSNRQSGLADTCKIEKSILFYLDTVLKSTSKCAYGPNMSGTIATHTLQVRIRKQVCVW